MKRLVIAAGLAAVMAVAGCSGSTGGSGEPVGINRQSSSASTSASVSSSAPTTTAEVTSAAPAPPSRTTAASPPPAPTTSTQAPPPTSSAPPTSGTAPVPAQIASVDAAGRCNGQTTGVANGSIVVTWTSTGADQVWLKAGQVAVALIGSDAKSGGSGPFPPNGSTTLANAFSCGDTTNYVLIQAYKSDGSGAPGQVTAVNRN